VFNLEDDDDELPGEDFLDSITNKQKCITLPTDIEGTDDLKMTIKILCSRYRHIFSTTVEPSSADGPPLLFDYKSELWEKPANRLPARIKSVEKQRDRNKI
jgi:hypothetical protein